MNDYGFFRYLTFGLRKEWVALFFHLKTDVLKYPSLGPIQKDALYCYLKDVELLNNKEDTSLFSKNISTLYKQEGIDSEKLWSLLWMNLCFNSSLFRWYCQLPCREYTREDCVTLLADLHGKRNRSVTNAYTALIGTLEKTPIGSDLRLGEIRKEGATRRIFKRGGYPFPPAVVLYALYKYAERAGQYRISLEQIAASPFSPHRLLAVDAEYVKRSLLSLFAPDILTVNVQDDATMFLLNPGKNSLNVIEMLMS